MNGKQFVRKLKRFGRDRGVEVSLTSERGKGSHQIITYGARRTTIPDLKRDLPRFYVNSLLKQLGIDPADFGA